jgi:TPR repeat protein
MGEIYLNGEFNQTPNFETALKWFKQSADQNYSKAQFQLAEMYANGNGVEKDYNEALEWYRKAIWNGSHYNSDDYLAEARLAYGRMALEGYEDMENAAVVVNNINSSNRKISAQKYQLLGDLYYKLVVTAESETNISDKRKNQLIYYVNSSVKNYGYAVKKWEIYRTEGPSASASDIQFRIKGLADSYCGWGKALILQSQNSGSSDFSEVMTKYQKAVDLGSTDAQCEIGDILLTGLGNIPADTEKAITMLSNLTEKNVKATFFLAKYYYDLGSDNYSLSFKYYKMIADEEKLNVENSVKADALQHISKMYLFGRGVPVNTSLADEYAQQAKEVGSKDVVDVAELIIKYLQQTAN